ncbi:class I SAM-dependent methyltransferase [Desulfobaculum sp.]
MYDAKAAFFDNQVTAPWASGEYGDKEQPKLDRLLAHLGDVTGAHILEPGCGTGRLTQHLAQMVGPQGRLVAMDVSPGMVRAAQKRLADTPNAMVCTAAVEDMPLGSDAFDIVLCHQVFPHIDDKPGALRRMTSALRPGRLFVISHFINSATINDHHRKAGSAVADDSMPPLADIRAMLDDVDCAIEAFHDDELGYLLTARLRAE